MADPLCPETNVGMRTGNQQLFPFEERLLLFHIPRAMIFPWLHPAGSFPVTQPWSGVCSSFGGTAESGEREQSPQHSNTPCNAGKQLNISADSFLQETKSQGAKEEHKKRIFTGVES